MHLTNVYWTPLYVMSKLGVSRIMEWLSGIFTQEKGEQKKTTFWYISNLGGNLILTMSSFVDEKTEAQRGCVIYLRSSSQKVAELNPNPEMPDYKQTNKQTTCYYYTKTIQIFTKARKQPRNHKWGSKNIKLLTRLKPCKNMFTCGQRVKESHG